MPDATAAYAPGLSFETGPFAPDFAAAAPPRAAKGAHTKARISKGFARRSAQPPPARAPRPRLRPVACARLDAAPLWRGFARGWAAAAGRRPHLHHALV